MIRIKVLESILWFYRPFQKLCLLTQKVRIGKEDLLALPADRFEFLRDSLLFFSQKITQQQQKMEIDQNQFQATLEGIVEGVLTIDHENRILFWNDSLVDLLGLSRTPRSGQLFSEEIRISEVAEMIIQVRQHRSQPRRLISVYLEGQEQILDTYARAVDMNKLQGVVLVFHDVSEQLRLEKMRRDFVANASHELKTPVTVIKGYVETLLDSAEQDPILRQKFLHKINENTTELSQLIDQLLELSNTESKIEKQPKKLIDVKSVFKEILDKYRIQAERKGLKMIEQMTNEDIHAYGTEDDFKQIFGNLIDNAIKFTNSPGIISSKISVEVNQVCLEILDSGIGISKLEKERIFERFYRIDKSRSSKVSGTGLGLAIVKHIVYSLHGTIEVHSEIGKGSQFLIRLPLIQP